MIVYCVEALNFSVLCIISIKSFSECEIEFAFKDLSEFLLVLFGSLATWNVIQFKCFAS
jgi:hypothetical protein